ncbi:uncharacterized protein [Palaemon carinicauda]|uniref:uncharacterized protein n=1 Tax=Palaemon carinicauda TaxID=392227 RepID=UPI0035B6607B
MRSLYRAGYAWTLERELQEYGTEMVALQEVRWPGTRKWDLEKGAHMYSGRDDGFHRKVAGYYLSRRSMVAVEEFDAISSRIFTYIVSAHAPSEVSEDQEKDKCYDLLQSVFRQNTLT